MKDLVCWIPCKDIEATLDSLLTRRTESLGIRPISKDIFKDPNRDSGCWLHGAQNLAAARASYRHGLLVLDQSWDGNPACSALDLEDRIRSRFHEHGIKDWADVVVIDPEVEIWVWTRSPHLLKILGWNGDHAAMKAWLEGKGLWPIGIAKPPDPKKAFEALAFRGQVRLSSSLFRQLAEEMSFRHCHDASFLRLQRILRTWFPIEV